MASSPISFFIYYKVSNWPLTQGVHSLWLSLPRFIIVVVLQSLSCVRHFVTPWVAACQASLSFTMSLSLLKLMPIELVIPFNHLILRCPLLLLSSIFPSIRVFFNELVLHIKWPKYWSFSFSINLTNEYLKLVSFTGLISLLSKGLARVFSSTTNSKASILRHSAFFMGFPGGASGKEPACWCRRHQRCRLDLWVGKIPWRRAWQPTLIFLPGESQGLRSLVGYSP